MANEQCYSISLPDLFSQDFNVNLDEASSFLEWWFTTGSEFYNLNITVASFYFIGPKQDRN
jgi:hypothetical protein